MARLSLYSLLLLFCLGLPLSVKPEVATARGLGESPTAPLTMPRQCQPGKTSPEALNSRWRPGTRVRVYFLKDNFNASEAEALSRAVESWNNALRETASRVVFEPGGESEVEAPQGTSITIMRGVPKGKERVGEIRLHSITNGRAHFLVVISPKVRNLNALTSLMTHELGHTMGLADCYECRTGTTAMAAFRGENRGNDVYEPSECDRFVVAAGYMNRTDTQAVGIVRLESK
jgi:hypothetical protein